MNKFGNKKIYDDEFEQDKSKSQVKRELLALKELGRELVTLPVKDLEKLHLSDALFDAVVKAQSLSHGALKRQIGFIGGLIAHEDYEAIQQRLNTLQQVHNGQVKQFHQVEQWRDLLLAGDDQVLSLLMTTFKTLDIQHVRQLVRNAQKEVTHNKPAKSSRLLFKYLQQCQQDIAP